MCSSDPGYLLHQRATPALAIVHTVDVPGSSEVTAESFYAELLTAMHGLSASSVHHASRGEVAEAVVMQIAADIANLELVAWERIVVTSTTPQVPLFDIASKIAQGMSALDTGRLSGSANAAAAVRSVRETLMTTIEFDLGSEIVSRQLSTEHLDALGMFDDAELHAALDRRLEGKAPGDFVASARAEAQRANQEARDLRLRGDTRAAIKAAYRADVHALDAYLVESALAVGDTSLLTVLIRRELAMAALERLGAVPDDYKAAVSQVRQTLMLSLGWADGERLARTLIPID